MLVLIAGVAGVAAWWARGRASPGTSTSAGAPSIAVGRAAIVSQARLEPAGGVLHIGAPMEGILARVVVREGQPVTAGEPLAYLTTHELRESERAAAATRIARSRLSPLDLRVQQDQIDRIAVDNADAERELERQKRLRVSEAASARDLDQASARLERAATEGKRAQSVLSKIEKNAVLDRREAMNQLAVAEAQLEQTVIRAPSDGTILRIIARAGERPGSQGIMVMGDTRTMTAVAEVHANDIRFLTVGQRARFTSPALADPIEGKVERIGSMVFRNNLFGEDPTAPENQRVFEVRVALDRSEVAARYTNLEGQVWIELEKAAP
jgi:HlyD family secretion protein